MSAAYRVEIVERIYGDKGEEIAVDVNDGDCIVRISRRGSLATIAHTMLNLGIELGSRGIIALPIVAVASDALL